MTGTIMDSDAPDTAKSPAGGSAIYFDGKSNQRRAVTLHFADRLEIRDGETTACGMGLCRYPPRRRSLRHAAPQCSDGTGAGAPGGSRCRGRGRPGLALRNSGREHARPPRRCGDRRLVARRHGFDRRGGAVRCPARRRSFGAAGAGCLRTAARRGRRKSGQDDLRRQGLRQCGRTKSLRQAR